MGKIMKNFLIISLFLSLPVLMSCQSNNVTSSDIQISVDSLYLDEKFPVYDSFSLESEQEIFMLDEEMLEMVESTLNTTSSPKKRAMKLIRHIFSKEKISLSYSNNANLTARDAYHSQMANCMSLTIMAFALAKQANLNVDFQEVDVPEYWVRNGNYNLLTGHVNLLVRASKYPDKDIIFGNDNIQIDFDPFINKQLFPRKIIGKNTVLAMFYNNKGGQALVDKKYNVAYQYLKAATVVDDTFSSAWGNLAVLYRLTDNTALAEKLYRYAVQIDSKNLTAMTNLAILLRNKGDDEEASLIESKLLRKRIKNPYYHAVLADEALHSHDYQKALSHYRKAIKLNKRVHEFHFGLAKVYYQMNKLEQAENALKKALVLNKTKSIEHQYVAKLNFLKAEITN